MKMKLFLVLIYSATGITAISQHNPGIINGFKYALVASILMENHQAEPYGVRNYIKNELSKKGLIVLSDDRNSWPKEAKINPCLIGEFIGYFQPGSFANSAHSGFVIKNCLGEKVYESSSSASHFGYYYNGNVPLAMEKAFKPISSFEYFYSPTLTPSIIYPKVEATNETEKSMKTYLSNNKLEPIEGIYQSYQSDNLFYYKIAITKSDAIFKAIVIESELPQWKPGEVKGYLEASSINTVFSTKWLLGNKSSIQTFAAIENDAILSIEVTNSSNEKEMVKFIKMYPPLNSNSIAKSENIKGSATGFFVSTNGIIATNSHVVQGANTIHVLMFNDLGAFTYLAKILLNDSKNDVALIQITDTAFKGLSNIPYSILEKGELGEKVFTIGYPLNEVMGLNCKVSDGIISSITGVNDDLRYFQISVPLQPGNSGGPLFDKDGNIIGITTAKLNSEAVGVQVENVNYAIKVSYLLNLYNMLPNAIPISNLSKPIGKELEDQIKTLKHFVCLIKIN
jgi:S1-C subfamily serine protease